MATFRKSASKTRAALENSTSLPPAASDVLDHVGEQAARMTNPAKTAKSARKAGSAPPGMPIPAPADAAETTATHAAGPVMDPSLDAAPMAVEKTAVVAETLAGATEPVVDAGAEAGAVAGDLATRSVDATTAELEGVMSDIADQVSHASEDVLRTTTDLTAQTFAETTAQAQDIAATMTDVAAVSTDGAAAALERVSAGRSEAESPQPLGEFNAKLADLFRDYLEDSLAFFAAMTAVRSVPEALTVNQQHFQRRFDAIAAQSRDLTLLAQRIAAQSLMPFTPAMFR